jgi:hypothetical protein
MAVGWFIIFRTISESETLVSSVANRRAVVLRHLTAGTRRANIGRATSCLLGAEAKESSRGKNIVVGE